MFAGISTIGLSFPMPKIESKLEGSSAPREVAVVDVAAASGRSPSVESMSQKEMKGGGWRLCLTCRPALEKGINISDLSEVRGGDWKKGRPALTSVTFARAGEKRYTGWISETLKCWYWYQMFGLCRVQSWFFIFYFIY